MPSMAEAACFREATLADLDALVRNNVAMAVVRCMLVFATSAPVCLDLSRFTRLQGYG